MYIIIGLGNPGEQFNHTPHNMGFEVLDAFSKKHDFPDFVVEKKLDAEISKKGKLVLVKPTTFMNNSGKAAKKISLLYKSKDIIVVHDDKDLELGHMKIVHNRGSAGHKGVESIMKAVGNKNLTRIRVGALPGQAGGTGKNIDAQKIILKHFSKNQELVAKKTIKQATEALACLIGEGLAQAMNQYNS